MREGLQVKCWGLRECGGFSAHLFIVCWMLCQGEGLPLLVGVGVPACARVCCTCSRHTLFCPWSHILQMCPDRPPHLRVGICLLSCAKSLLYLKWTPGKGVTSWRKRGEWSPSRPLGFLPQP